MSRHYAAPRYILPICGDLSGYVFKALFIVGIQLLQTFPFITLTTPRTHARN